MNRNEQTQQNRDALARARASLLADYRAAFTSEPGGRVLEHLRDSAGCGKPAFLPAAGGGPFDPYAAAFRDGRKSILDEIGNHLATPEAGEDEGGPAAIK